MIRKTIAGILTFLTIFSLSTYPVISAKASYLNGLTANGEGAFQDLARCVRSVDSTDLNIFFLVDSSASLRVNDSNNGPGSDPGAKRAVILSQTVRQLSSLNEKISVNFALDTFDTSSPGVGKNGSRNKGIGWTRASASNVSSASTWIATNIPQYSYGQHTNWQAGLSNAQSQLAKAPHAGSGACQAIIWFTDGALDIGSNSQNSAALESLCGANPASTGPGIARGIISSLRTSNITLIGVLLNSGPASTMKSGLVSYFQPVLEGSGVVDASSFGGSKNQNFECGISPIPASYSRGAMLVAKNPEDLALLFATIPFMVSKGGEITHKDPNGFTVDKGVSSVAVVIPSNTWKLIGPNVSIDQSTTDSAYKIHTAGNISSVEFNIPNGGQGDYKVTQGSNNAISVFLDAGIRINLSDGIKLTSGKGPQQITGTFSDYENHAVDLSVYGEATLGVASIDTSGKNRPSEISDLKINRDSWSGVVTPFDGENSAELQFSLALQTKPSAIDLPKISQTFNVPLIFPAQFCNVRNVGNAGKDGKSQPQLSDLVFKKSAATGKIIIDGAHEGNCAISFGVPVVLNDPIGRGPKDFSLKLNRGNSSQLSVPGTWITIPQGKEEEFTVKVDSAVKANGLTQMLIPVSIQDEAKSQVIKTSARFNFTNKIPEKNKILFICLLLFIGLLLPILLLQIINFFFARYRMQDIRITSMKVKVNGATSTTTITLPNGDPLVLEDRMFEYPPVTLSRPRGFIAEFKNQKLAVFNSQLPRNPFGNVLGTVKSLPGDVIVSSESSRSGERGTKASVSLNLNRLFIASTEVVAMTQAAAPVVHANDQSLLDDDFNFDQPTSVVEASLDKSSQDRDQNSFEANLTIFLNIEPGQAKQLFMSVLSDIASSQIWTELSQLRMASTTTPKKDQTASKSKKRQKVEKVEKKSKVSEVKQDTGFEDTINLQSSDSNNNTKPSGSSGKGDSFTSLLDDPDDPWA